MKQIRALGGLRCQGWYRPRLAVTRGLLSAHPRLGSRDVAVSGHLLTFCGFPFWIHIRVAWAAWEILLSGFARGSQAGPGLVTAAPGHSGATWDRAGHPRARWQTGR